MIGLNRLTGAIYSDGRAYQYTYDAVGNRLSQTITVGGISATTQYLYDEANRMVEADGRVYDYDPNGNLLSDGVNTYTYDAANRLSSVTSSQGSVTSYAYNGLGDRLQETRWVEPVETTNGVTTTFSMDLNAGLTQALSDGTNDYIYGVGRIAQVSATDTQYFLADALGSVRQLTDSTGALTLSKTYDPYGVPTTVGASASSYGFTGEYQTGDSVYLRSRFYAPATGRFLTRDTWSGDANRPLSFNRWGYVEGNPVNLTDPTGMSPECAAVAGSADYIKCERIIRGFDPRSGPSLMELALLDLGDDCIAIRFSSFLGYMKLPPPSDDDYEDYGLWFHYLLNEKSIREGKGRVSIGMATAIIASREANVDSLYDTIKRPIANAMILKGRARGIYVAIGSRQLVIENVESSILFMGGIVLSSRNWYFCNNGAGAGHCYDSFEALIKAYTPLELARADMPGIVADAFRDNPSAPSDPENAPDDWGNVTQHTLDLLPNPNHTPPKGIMDVLRKTRDPNAPFDPDPWGIAWYSNDKGLGQFFIRTPNQATNLCPPAGDCIGQSIKDE